MFHVYNLVNCWYDRVVFSCNLLEYEIGRGLFKDPLMNWIRNIYNGRKNDVD